MFGPEEDLDAFAGLDAEGELVTEVVLSAGWADTFFGMFKGDGDVDEFLGEVFAGFEDEGDVCPARVVEVASEFEVGLGLGVLVNARFLGVALVLGTKGLFVDVCGVNVDEGFEDLGSLFADSVCVHAAGVFHSDDGEHLEEVVLAHVPEGSDVVIEGTSTLDVDVLVHANVD